MSGYFCNRCGWHPCRCDDWRQLEQQRRIAHPELRGVAWECGHHSNYLDFPIEQRGPLPKNGHKFANQFGTYARNPRRFRVMGVG